MLALADKVKTAFNVSSLASKFAILGNLNSGFVIDHEDGRDGR